MYAVVTGVAGFIGSHLAGTLVLNGYRVLGVDCFTDYYDPSIKRANLAELVRTPRFELAEVDIRHANLERLLDGADAVFHQAGQPGVRGSFGAGFAGYCAHNVVATQRILEAAKTVGTPRLVFASSSSIYGNAPSYPTTEDDLPQPYSPYGVTKLAAEHLCRLYAANWGLSTVSLRYFSVYGPRQRPDMAIQRLLLGIQHGLAFPLFGEGTQVRDFTYVDDVVRANIAAGTAEVEPGTILNISGGSNVTMLEVIELVEELTGARVLLDRRPSQAGDVQRSGGSAHQAHIVLGWEPKVTFREGLHAQVEATKPDVIPRPEVTDACP